MLGLSLARKMFWNKALHVKNITVLTCSQATPKLSDKIARTGWLCCRLTEEDLREKGLREKTSNDEGDQYPATTSVMA